MTLEHHTPPERAWFRRLMPLPAPPQVAPRPTADADQARARFAGLAARDADIPEATRSVLLEPEGGASATVVVWHGFTNAPANATRLRCPPESELTGAVKSVMPSLDRMVLASFSRCQAFWASIC